MRQRLLTDDTEPRLPVPTALSERMNADEFAEQIPKSWAAYIQSGWDFLCVLEDFSRGKREK